MATLLPIRIGPTLEYLSHQQNLATDTALAVLEFFVIAAQNTQYGA